MSPSAVVIRRDLYDALGGFDPTFTICEDYELWLRIALREAVGSSSAARRQARGHRTSSRSTWGLDRFRVAALVKLLATAALAEDERAAVTAVLAAKCAVLAQGAARRGRDDEAARYRLLARAGGMSCDVRS